MSEGRQLAFLETGSGAKFSPCRTWRYFLRREWSSASKVAFIMLNPSTADETQDDPTIRRCIGYAKAWGYGGLVVGNIFAFRSTDPRGLLTAADPVGPDNDYWLANIGLGTDTICAWGTHGKLQERGAKVLKLLRSNGAKPMALKLTTGGQPSHPLYLAGNLRPFHLPRPEGIS
jgi:hypothetical protein